MYDAAMNAPQDTPPDTTPGSRDEMDPQLLELLVCPLTRSRLRQEGDELVAEQPEGAGLRYPIRGGMPVMLMDQARLPEGIASLDEFKRKYADSIPESP